MGTALAVTQQQSIQVADRSWARVHNTDRCPRCSGFMVAEWCEDLSDYTAMRRGYRPGHSPQPRSPARTDDNSACREDVAEQLRDERSIERCRRNDHGVSRWGG
jgi:hypothetical protein